ncbi:MAG: PH domain-containing protein, partial [Chloroflexia bacterium]|nr:PH domain-containing protein [Chloroflexia bacterium]
ALLLGLPLIIFGLLVVMLVFVAWAAYEVEDYRNDTYTLTPEKVIDIEKKPFGPEDRREAGLGSINNVQSKTTYISNLLGYGDVELSTAGSGGNFTFHRVPRPADVVTKITEYNVRFKRKDKDRALNDTLALLRHYHEAQIKHDEIKT